MKSLKFIFAFIFSVSVVSIRIIGIDQLRWDIDLIFTAVLKSVVILVLLSAITLACIYKIIDADLELALDLLDEKNTLLPSIFFAIGVLAILMPLFIMVAR